MPITQSTLNAPSDSSPTTSLAHDLPGCLAALNARLDRVEDQVQRQPFFQFLSDSETPPAAIFAFMREVFRDVFSYQKRIDEAVFTAVGRFGQHVDEQTLVRSMIAVQNEEVGHGRLALHDFAALGGDVAALEASLPSPNAAAVIAVTAYLAKREDPLCHLGFMYFFERFTTRMTDRVAPLLAARGYPDDRLQFMRLHAEEDVRHADMLGAVIEQVCNRYEGAEAAILRGFDCFAVVYPCPLWEAAWRRAGAELAAEPAQ